MKKSISLAAILIFFISFSPTFADTIDRMWYDVINTPSGNYSPGAGLRIPLSIESYFADNNITWNRGAGVTSRATFEYNGFSINNNTIQYNLLPPADGILLTYRDFGSLLGGTPPCTEGTLGISGPLILEAEIGARVAYFRSNTLIVANEPNYCSISDFYPYSANVGDMVPFEFMLILDDGNTWDSTAFNSSWEYYTKGHIDFVNFSLVADAGPDLNSLSCTEITLDGSASSDSNGTIVQYRWRLLHRTDHTRDMFANVINPTFSNLSPGVYDVILTVTNNIGFKDFDTMVLTISPECAPTIADVRIFRDGTPPIESYFYNIGEKAFFEITIEDPDLDAARLILEEYYPPNSATPYLGPYIFNLPPQPSSPAYFHTIPTPVTGPEGEWRLSFIVEDAGGNESTAFDVLATVGPSLQAGGTGSSSSSGDGGGGGGCFIGAIIAH